MTLTVNHAFVSAIADDPTAAAAGEVVPSNWNAAHVLNGGTPGSVPFIGAGSVLAQNNAALFWDNTSLDLQINATAGKTYSITGRFPGAENIVGECAYFNTTNVDGGGITIDNTSMGGQPFQIISTGNSAAGFPAGFLVFVSPIVDDGNWTFAIDGTTANVQVPSDSSYGFSNTVAFAGSSTYHVNIYSKGAGQVDIWQRSNQTSPCALKIYNTITGGVAYFDWEVGVLDWITTSNVFSIGTNNFGTGVARNMQFVIGGVNKFDYGVTNSGTWTSATPLNFSGTLAFEAAGTTRLDWNSTNSGVWTITAPAVGGNTPGLTIDAGSGSAGAWINLVGRNSGTGSTAAIFADFSGVLNLSSTNGQVQLTSASTQYTSININNTSTGGKQFQLISTGSAWSHGAGLIELADQSGAILERWNYDGTSSHIVFGSTAFVSFANNVFGDSPDVAIYRDSSGVLQINDAGTVGNYRDLKLRNLTASTNITMSALTTAGIVVNSSAGALSSVSSVTSASVPANFSANRYLTINIAGTNYFIPADTAAW